MYHGYKDLVRSRTRGLARSFTRWSANDKLDSLGGHLHKTADPTTGRQSVWIMLSEQEVTHLGRNKVTHDTGKQAG